MRRTLSVIALCALAGAANAMDRGSQADQDACTPDVMRLCSAYIPDEAPIVACLQSKRQSLSPACYNVFYPRRAKRDLDMTPTGSIGTARHARQVPLSHRRVVTAR